MLSLRACFRCPQHFCPKGPFYPFGSGDISDLAYRRLPAACKWSRASLQRVSLCNCICIYIHLHAENRSAVRGVISLHQKQNMVKMEWVNAFIQHFQWQNLLPLSTFWGSVITDRCFAGRCCWRLDILSVIPSSMCDCFYLFNTEKDKVEFYKRKKGIFYTQTG